MQDPYTPSFPHSFQKIGILPIYRSFDRAVICMQVQIILPDFPKLFLCAGKRKHVSVLFYFQILSKSGKGIHIFPFQNHSETLPGLCDLPQIQICYLSLCHSLSVSSPSLSPIFTMVS